MTLPKPKEGILSIEPYVAGKSKAAKAAMDIIKLSSNENNLGASPLAIQAVVDHAKNIHRYPDSSCAELRKAIAEVHNLDAERIICGAGSDELIGLLVHAYAGAGDEVLYSQYGFLMYKIYTQAAGATPVVAKEKNLTASVDALLAKVTDRTRLVFLANPNNPTGSYLSWEELQRLRAGLRKDIILVIDAAYAEYAEKLDYSDGRGLVYSEDTTNTVMLKTFSKIYGLSSLRLGWGYFPKGVAEVINRIRGPFNVSAVAQIAGIAAVRDKQYTGYVKAHNLAWLEWLSSEISELGFTVHPSIANFILVEFKDKKKTAKAANEFLMERGFIPREVSGYGLPNCLRITVGKDDENKALVEALKDFKSA
jgi:histidinol-phosphate aminotransferase